MRPLYYMLALLVCTILLECYMVGQLHAAGPGWFATMPYEWRVR
jgi:hypothetical protein